uniref:Uncharacterized protein n=1 Tax=Anguilla anguilla TaxID=7936 RepID=A0A0E9SR85_ANGAN
MKYKCSRVTYLNCRVAYCLFNIGEYVVKYGISCRSGHK